ncbi:MAG: hypothetical protein JW955_05320 [Sedimentisphaerales bacterium]|nr:hypothetical protein [Sedimentisphaerales bacterium]
MKRRILFIAAVCILPAVCLARGGSLFPYAWYVPYDRLIANTEAFIREHPNDPQGYYTLGRMHYFTFLNRIPFVPTRKPDGLPPDIAADWQLLEQPHWLTVDRLLYDVRGDQAQKLVLEAWGYPTRTDVPSSRLLEFDNEVWRKRQELEQQGWRPEYIETDKVLAHAGAAVDNLERALDLDPENGLYYLSLASLYEEYVSYTADVNVTEHPRQLASVTIPRIRVTYCLAYRFSIEDDRNLKSQPVWANLHGIVSHEAGSAYVRLAAEEPAIGDANSVAQVKADLARLESLPTVRPPITPIIFSVRKHESVLELLAPDTHVTFDLDGMGRDVRWPWIKSTTGLLVWDPLNKGDITSGRQLFGTATWWMLFANGYLALDTLDDNRDGSLSGRELRGIGVWFDKNNNGRSEPGEVQPVTGFGVQAIRTRSTGTDHGMLMNAGGILLKDGTTVPTYDWLVSPVPRNPKK